MNRMMSIVQPISRMHWNFQTRRIECEPFKWIRIMEMLAHPHRLTMKFSISNSEKQRIVPLKFAVPRLLKFEF